MYALQDVYMYLNMRLIEMENINFEFDRFSSSILTINKFHQLIHLQPVFFCVHLQPEQLTKRGRIAMA